MVETSTKTLPKLKVLNSFTKQKEEFVPEDPSEILWYTCGPTVYDHSHMGHARTYVSFDIIRRIMTDFFGYNIKLVMNITDLDDKIIRKSIEEKTPFDQISRHFETEFLDDMKKLNVALPEVITRVTEYVPEIVAYIKKIVDNGYAYESNGSVYFDVQKFKDTPNHSYAKLEPNSANDDELIAEGEGVLTDTPASEKRNQRDFALWKKSKPDEPEWDSPWSKGRPGWHIECSAMASAIFDKYPMDIHSGGVDLRFPHHDNEIAQAEAFYDCDGWVNHFWHTGHLHIEGKKMSKSLKNFITIKQILEIHSARQIRWLFLIHNWDNLMNYSTEKSLPEAVAKDKQFTEFFRKIKTVIRTVQVKSTVQKWDEADVALSARLVEDKRKVHERLADSFDTPSATGILSDLVVYTNTYLQQNEATVKVPLVRTVSKYIFFVLKSFGLYEEDDTPNDAAEEGAGSKEETITPYMNAMSEFRDQVKARANEGPKVMYQLSDELRDNVLPGLGIRLGDKKAGEAAIWDFVDPAILLKEQEEKKAAAAKAIEDKRIRAEQDLKKKSTPGNMFYRTPINVNTQKSQAEFTSWDENGIPTKKTDKKGKETDLSEKEQAKLSKAAEKQEKTYQEWLAKQPKAEEQKAQEEQKVEEVPNKE